MIILAQASDSGMWISIAVGIAVAVALPSDRSVRMVLTFDAMHDEEWTRRTVMGWESELGKLAKVLGT